MDALETLLKDLPVNLPIWGEDFHESIWDEEFSPKFMAPVDCEVLKSMIADGLSPYYISTQLLKKIGCAPKPEAQPQAIALTEEDEALLIFSVQDIYELPPEQQPKRRPPKTMRRLKVPAAQGYSKQWKGKWITRREINQRYWVSRYLLRRAYGFPESGIKKLECWMEKQGERVRLHENPHHPKWAPMRLYEYDVVVKFLRANGVEI